MIPCETAQTTLSQDNQGRAWEHFWLSDSYQFSNQIPNLKSFTRTDPGWVLSDNHYCTWQGEAPPRMREDAPVVTGQVEIAESEIAPITASAGMTSGGFGIMVLVAAAVGGVMWWQGRDKTPDPNYHPMSDMPYQLPVLSAASVQALPDEIEWQEGDPIPEGYELVDEDNSPKLTEPSPWLPDALKEQIEATAQQAARSQTHTAFMQGINLMERVYPRSQPATSTTPESLSKPVVGLVEAIGCKPVGQPVRAVIERDPREVELFEETVQAFCPLPLLDEAGETREAVREALRLGKSQNWITANLFRVSKGTKDYEQAVSIVKAVREAVNG
ncbi:MAG TPA: hypothetical protein V6D07_00235 [Trichocoleus sp.]